jgi:hypothetical protein
MQVSRSPDRIAVRFDDDHAVADAGLILAASLAEGLLLRELFETHVELGDAPGAANAGDKAMTLIHSALAGGEWIEDADRLRAGATVRSLGIGSPRPRRWGCSCARSLGDRRASSTRSSAKRCAGRGPLGAVRGPGR